MDLGEEVIKNPVKRSGKLLAGFKFLKMDMAKIQNNDKLPKLEPAFNIPVDLCIHTLKNKLSRSFQLYILLKSSCSGKRLITQNDRYNLANDLDLNIKTINNHFNKLQLLNWVGYNPKSGYYFIRSFDRVKEIQNLNYRSAAEFDPKEIKKFKAFIIGAVIGYLVNSQKKDRRLEPKKAHYNRSRPGRHPSYFPISSEVLANILNVSQPTAHRYIELAKKAGYIRIKKNNLIPTGISVKHYQGIKKTFPDSNLRIKNNQLFIQKANSFASNIHFKTQKKRKII